ncbi:peptidyl-prolyl cis-trans isomerase [Leptotrichia sp. OH3620_COT-345]|uniref:peptidylprolyl isomerase n=1 Tax=Leptotrichia sp. OH3620_COT-345 TaxID=2491048 RepID=UPI000F6453C9|nr:peptidylprolyl isomerase [Leptotrichia sp. OH3620_COT-345]RRD40716.1 peptidyl-prolyl cis-trans isomerase [Leptotrichia sp. OH3620_COT-345]
MKNKMKLSVITILCIFAFACGNSGKSGKVVFESEDKKIKVYESELNYELERNLEAAGVELKEVPKEQLEQMKISIIQNIATARAFAFEAKEKKLDKSKKYIDGIGIAKENLLASVVMMDRLNSINISDDEAKKIYEANKTNFERTEDEVRLQLIVTPTSEKSKAEEALKEAKANPEKFGELVKKYTGVQNGSTGETEIIKMSDLSAKYAPVSEAVKSLQNGQIADSVIVVGDEAYVVKLLERYPKGVEAFDKVKDQIKAQMKASKRQEETQRFIEDIAREYKLDKINKETVKLPESKK